MKTRAEKVSMTQLETFVFLLPWADWLQNAHDAEYACHVSVGENATMRPRVAPAAKQNKLREKRPIIKKIAPK